MLSVIVRSTLTKYRGLWVPSQFVVRAMSSSAAPTSPYTTLAISHPAESVTHVELHRPEKRNAMNKAFWSEMVDCFNEIAGDPDCRVVVVSGAGKIFTAGIDLMDMASDVLQPQGDDTARVSWNLRQKIAKYQETFSVIEKCPKPVVVAVHGACVGGGVDLITACDIRLCTQDAWFQVKEVDIGLAADVGTLQRLPKVIGSSSLVNDLALTARKMYADEAKSSGLVSRVFADKEAMMAGALEMADEIAARSPIAVQGTKINLIYARDHSVAEGLDYMATWNMSMLQTQDVMKSAQAAMEKKSPKTIAFSKL
ncbi:delta(3,5)-Delta(2,4)-dienoyl-CoA isomerase, mitochondrial isoform X1 [Seriola lalandi dorsalis]|uniref:Delta(3,5)-Delta(2,4)-dienoyl-CoA isomerase, mitochondrial n=3 Tax=Seriola TaxID=8160 RepID=A0A3B4X2T1_SERLL|nr:delta(3,5)-Delta(2,4)-dienoyl-CoA isomerase, mitochondrial isoform X1 [Seriola lalandi dorsalis]XP_023266108.1 delta(3,5)-Delta(2,4)-dienoyl-CoA isomerase, mitochondrial isoform X1 [Seriola lalandi dorsalis]